jgi:hypothetical protein
LDAQRKKMEQIKEYSNHDPADKTVCEYLVMVNQVCDAFSVITNIEGFAIKGRIKNIMLDAINLFSLNCWRFTSLYKKKELLSQ